MAIYKGDKEIVGLYKGPTEIIKRYKGSNLIYNVFKWLPYSYEHIYNSLVPSVINNKNVKDKAHISTIYGNSVVENQLIAESSPHPCYQSWTIDNSQSTSPSYAAHQWNCDSSIRLTIGHKYLIWFSGTKSYSGNGACKLYINVANKQAYVFDFKTQNANIITIDSIEAPESLPTFNTILGAGAILTVDGYLCFADLTQWFPFNTPTTLTDTRVQEIVNRGHILYNVGTLKNVDIGEISSEPYNLFDGELEVGKMPGGIPDTSTDGFRTKNYIRVIAGQTYSFENGNNITPIWDALYLYEFDENKNLIAKRTLSYNPNNAENKITQFSVSNNTFYIRLAALGTSGTVFTSANLPKGLSIHLTGSRTGYAPHTQSYTLPFKYQGGGVGASHDTMEDGGTEWIFTKDRTLVDLGSLTYAKVQTANGYCFYGALPTSKLVGVNVVANLLCPEYSADTYARVYNNTNDKTIARQSDGQNIVIYDSAFNEKTPEEVKVFLSGIPLEHQLATPQVVRIPKKHLAVVDLGTLDWTYNSGRFYVALKGIKKASSYDAIPNLYCSKYLTASKRQIDNGSPDKIIGTSDNIEYIYIIDSAYTDATTFKQAVSGIYLFYETQDEVADILSDINIEAGGTLTSNWFSWVENQNALPLTSNKWASPSAYGTLTGATATSVLYTRNQTDYAGNVPLIFQAIEGGYGSIAGHKYLIKCTITPSASFKFRAYIGTYGNVYNPVANVKNYFAEIITANSNGYLQFISENGGHLPLGGTVLFENIQCIDLTLGFGAGKEPTSIDDPRIQYIIEQGYIPTNTAGTNKSVASEVLPNIDFKMKCR